MPRLVGQVDIVNAVHAEQHLHELSVAALTRVVQDRFASLQRHQHAHVITMASAPTLMLHDRGHRRHLLRIQQQQSLFALALHTFVGPPHPPKPHTCKRDAVSSLSRLMPHLFLVTLQQFYRFLCSFLKTSCHQSFKLLDRTV